MIKKCSNCIFGDTCPGVKVCNDYYPIDEEGAYDEYLSEMISIARHDFQLEYDKYISEQDD